jgi:uncharacterized protein
MIRSCGGFILRKSATWWSMPNPPVRRMNRTTTMQQSTSNSGNGGSNGVQNNNVPGVKNSNNVAPPAPGTNSVVTSTTSFAIGTLAGLLGSLAGMGGGFVMIPLMTSRHIGLRLTQHEAHGTSLFAVAATGFAGAFSYYNAKTGVECDDGSGHSTNVVHIPEAAAIAVTAMITARWGAQSTLHMSGLTLKRALGCLMLLMAPAVPAKAYFLQQSRNDSSDKAISNMSNHYFTWNRLFYPALIGIGSGFLSGVFGVGGGTIVVPALTFLTDLTHHEALGTSLAAMTIPAISGTYTHYNAGNCSLRVAPFLASGALVGAYIGAKQAMNMDESTLRWGFSVLLATLGCRTLIKA